MVGVFLGYAGRYGQALIYRRLYLPKEWAEDAARRAKAQVPTDAVFATKPELAREMIAAALDAAPLRLSAGGRGYGSDSRLWRMLEERHQPYTLTVRYSLCLCFLTRKGLIQTSPVTATGD